MLKGNYIGTNAAGTAAIDPNAIANGIVGIEDAANNTTISGNLIGGVNTAVGLSWNILGRYDGRGSTVQGNFIGITSAGAIIPNGQGVVVDSGVDYGGGNIL